MKIIRRMPIIFISILMCLTSYNAIAGETKPEMGIAQTMVQASPDDEKALNACLDGLIRAIIEKDKSRAISIVAIAKRDAPYLIYFSKRPGDKDPRRGLFLENAVVKRKNYDTEPVSYQEYKFIQGGMGIINPEGDYFIQDGTKCMSGTKTYKYHHEKWYSLIDNLLMEDKIDKISDISGSSKIIGITSPSENKIKDDNSQKHSDNKADQYSEKPKVHTKESSSNKIVIAISYFKFINKLPNENKEPERLHKILSDALNSSDDFKLLDPNAYIEDPAKTGIELENLNFWNWTVIGAEMLITGSVNNTDPENVELMLRLFDTSKSSIILSKNYSGPKVQTDKLIYTFCKEIKDKLIDEEYLSK